MYELLIVPNNQILAIAEKVRQNRPQSDVVVVDARLRSHMNSRAFAEELGMKAMRAAVPTVLLWAQPTHSFASCVWDQPAGSIAVLENARKAYAMNPQGVIVCIKARDFDSATAPALEL